MSIKNIFLLTLIIVTTIHAMEKEYVSPIEKSLLDTEKIYHAFVQTPQYENYNRAKKLHEKHNTKETHDLIEEAAGKLLETEEGQLFLHTIEQKEAQLKTTPIFSDNVLAKHRIMQNTAECIQYEEAKINHAQYNTADTLLIVELCRSELRNTKECQAWLRATDQEKHVVESITKSKNMLHVQKRQVTELERINTIIDKRNHAWRIVQATPQYLSFKQAECNHEQCNTDHTLSQLNMNQETAKQTQEYLAFQKEDRLMWNTIKKQISITFPNGEPIISDCIHKPKENSPYLSIKESQF